MSRQHRSHFTTRGTKLENLIHEAEKDELTYTEFISRVFLDEIGYRHAKAQARRIKDAGFPYPKYLKDFDLTFCKSVSARQFKQLSELTWIDGIYNLILSGPPGVGKSHLAIGLGYHACEVYHYAVTGAVHPHEGDRSPQPRKNEQGA